MQQPDLRYPIGPFRRPSKATAEERRGWLEQIAATPAELRAAVAGLSDEQLDTRYRPGGWTVRQVVHHLADSHLNSYLRFKWALTEPTPTIKAYDEKVWAELADSRGPIGPSLELLEALHMRWHALLASMSDDDYERCFLHPESGREMPLYVNLALYAWHGPHHTAHISALRTRMNW